MTTAVDFVGRMVGNSVPDPRTASDHLSFHDTIAPCAQPKPRAMAKSSKFYAVRKGRTSGIFRTWSECQASVKGFSGAEFKSFKEKAAAEQFLLSHNTTSSQTKRKTAEDASLVGSTGRQQQQPPAKRNKQEGSRRNNPIQLDNHDAQHSPSSPGTRVHIMFDGGARGNPGVAGAGASVRIVDATGTATVLHLRDYVGDHATNNVAEYRGAVTGLRVAYWYLQQRKQKDESHPSVAYDVILQGDSSLIIRQLLGTYQVKHPSLKPLYREAMQSIGKFRASGSSVRIEHVYRNANGVADGTC